MIEFIRARNFQSHADSQIDLDGRVTVVVGTSNSGKSAIIRALEWVRTNRPRGKSFIRLGTARALVEVGCSESGVLISRERAKSDNKYTVEDEEFSAVGTGVPEEVTQALGISEIQVQRQLDGPFLVLESPGKVAAAINEAVGLDSVVPLQSELRRRARQIDSDLETARADGQRARDKLDLPRYALLDSAVQTERRHATLVVAEEVCVEEAGGLQTVLREIDLCCARMEEYAELPGWRESVEDLGEYIEDLVAAVRHAEGRADTMEGLIGSVRSLDDRIGPLARTVEIGGGAARLFQSCEWIYGVVGSLANQEAGLSSTLETIARVEGQARDRRRSVCTLGQIVAVLEDLEARNAQIRRTLAKMDAIELSLQRAVALATRAKAERGNVEEARKALAEAVAEAGTCPFCGSEITESQQEVLARLSR